MPKLRNMLVAVLVGLSAPVLTHAHYINNPPPPPPGNILEAAVEILRVTSGFYATVERLELGTLTDVQDEFRQLSGRLFAVAGLYERYAETLEQGTPTPIQKDRLPDGLRGMVERTFTPNSSASFFLQTNISEPSSDAEVFRQAARVLIALSEVLRAQSQQMTSTPNLDGIEQFAILNSAVLEAVHVMALHSALLWTMR